MTRLPLVLLLLVSILGSAHGGSGSDLPRSVPEAEGIDSAGVLSLVDAMDRKINAVHSIMLVRHGKVVAEGWWSPYAAGDVHIMYSVTKSFTSTAVGFAVQEGRLSVDDLVLSFFPDLAPAEPAAQMKAMRIRDLLMMSTGHQQDTADLLRARKDGAWTRAFLATEVAHKPGTHFLYNSGASYMLAAIVQKVSGQTVEAYLQPRLFDPLGIEQHPWGLSPEGVNLGDGGLSIKTEDLAKFGLLYLQKGMWNGRRLLSAEWIEAATSRQTSSGSAPDSNWDHGYGYQFWRNKTTGFRADGAFGQFSFVLPEYDVVLAVTSGTSDMAGVMDLVWEHLLPALHYVTVPANPAAQEKLAQRLATLVLPAQGGAAHSPRESEISRKIYSFGENEQGIKSVEIDFAAGNPVLVFKDADGSHAIACGLGQWVRGRTGFQKRISTLFDREDQGIAASGGWGDDNTFTAKLCFDETPYTITATFKFTDDKLLLNFEHNLRWGEIKPPQLVGTWQESTHNVRE
jgi:CubicO group peptidase (beta-lactamase class C family)